ncbi:hypothetical protein F5Y18DRAFT_403704 [Xylariaceae sp. FL1019]|nr:hypothetical protein F5Y18DRAFT_403704 [Xylariaceae sp. FL1019]
MQQTIVINDPSFTIASSYTTILTLRFLHYDTMEPSRQGATPTRIFPFIHQIIADILSQYEEAEASLIETERTLQKVEEDLKLCEAQYHAAQFLQLDRYSDDFAQAEKQFKEHRKLAQEYKTLVDELKGRVFAFGRVPRIMVNQYKKSFPEHAGAFDEVQNQQTDRELSVRRRSVAYIGGDRKSHAASLAIETIMLRKTVVL